MLILIALAGYLAACLALFDRVAAEYRDVLVGRSLAAARQSSWLRCAR